MKRAIRTLVSTLGVAAWLAAGLLMAPALAADPGPPLPVIAVDASSDDGNVPGNAVDGDLATRWSAQGDGVWLRLRLDASHEIGSVAIAWHQGDQRRADFDVQTSADGSSWTTVYSGTSSGSTLQAETYALTKTTATYLRVVGHGNTVNDWTSIAEISVFTDSAGEPGDCALPSEALDLARWKITLPIDDPGKSGTQPLEILQPALADYQIDPWFIVRPGCDGAQFRSPVNGVTTSGSSYPRSELREMKSNGTSQASWSSGSGTHTLTILQAITRLPASKPHVVAGQIHDGSDDVSVFRLEGSKLYVTNGDDSHYKLVTDGYVLGTAFEAKFVVSNDKIMAYYNGALQTTISKSFSGGYFKAGAYTQANCSNSSPCSSGNYGEVVIYEVTVSHP